MNSNLTYDERHKALIAAEDQKDNLIKVERQSMTIYSSTSVLA